MNDYDKASRYLIKRDSEGFLRWFLENLTLVFLAWIDVGSVQVESQSMSCACQRQWSRPEAVSASVHRSNHSTIFSAEALSSSNSRFSAAPAAW